MTDFTIVVPHRGAALGLWATIHSCEEELITSDRTYNYVVVTNGEEVDADTNNTLTHLDKTGRLLRHLHFDEPLAPPVARQRGAALADGKVLFFFDNHCLVGRLYFERALACFEKNHADMVHSVTKFHSGFDPQYHYELSLEANFWAASSSSFVGNTHRPYKCAAGGHGGIAVKRSVWEEVDGYGPESLFVGYAGEEMAFDLKLWRMGKTVWLDPRMVHYHFAGTRPYSRHYSDEYYTNLLVSAFVVGGERWLYKVFSSFITKCHLRIGAKQHWFDLLQAAYRRGAEYAAVVDAKSVRSLDELLAGFKAEQVAA